MWDLPRPGLEPVSPALAGGFLTTAPPGKPNDRLILKHLAKDVRFAWDLNKHNELLELGQRGAIEEF